MRSLFNFKQNTYKLLRKYKSMRYILFIFLALLIFAYGCIDSSQTSSQAQNQDVVQPVQNTPSEEEATSPEPESKGGSKTYTVEEVSSHSSENDCWIVIHGKVYDVTSFISQHPGGNAILQGCGKDATELFETRPMGSGTPHSEDAREKLPYYYIGELSG